MAYCRYCGKELIDGECSCAEFQASIGKVPQTEFQDPEFISEDMQSGIQFEEEYDTAQDDGGRAAMQNQGGEKDPFLVQNFNPDFSSFSAFITSMRDMSGRGEADSMEEDPFEHDIPIVPDCIEPEENEIVVKQYNIAKLRSRLKFTRAEGRLMVTNRRVLFRAAGKSPTGNVIQEHQFNLDEIGGVELHKDYKFSILNLVGTILLFFGVLFLSVLCFKNVRSEGVFYLLGFLFGFAGLVPTVVVYKHPWFKLLGSYFSICGFLFLSLIADHSLFYYVLTGLAVVVMVLDIIIILFIPNLVIRIKTTGSLPAVSLGSQKSIFQRQTGDDQSGFKEVLPWEDTMMAINELGTLIDDLQKQGDYAVEKWTSME